ASAPKQRQRLAAATFRPDTSVGMVRADAATISRAETYPNNGFPPIDCWREAIQAANPSATATPRSRHLWRRAWCSRRPRAIASTGATAEASRAGANADKIETPTPAMNASTATDQLKAIAPGVLVTYSDSTVAETNRTAPSAIKRPSPNPALEPSSPK